MNATQKLVSSRLHSGETVPGREIALRVDQTLTQDATGTLVMLALEAMGVDRVETELSVQYVDHNLIQEDHRNPDDHLFLSSASRRFGVWFSGPGNGVSHPVHMQHFGRPGRMLLGSDSHTCAAGALGMLAVGAGGMEVALAMAGEPFYLTMPEVFGVRLTGELREWVSAKDVILEMLRRHGVSGGVGRVIEYHGPGVSSLSIWDRHVVANMGAELGATTTVFPSDDTTRTFLAAQGREEQWCVVAPDEDAGFDVEDEIDLSMVEPLVARPSSPDAVVPVREVAGTPIFQGYLGSSANPGFRDFAIAAEIADAVPSGVSFDVNPTSREILLQLVRSGHLGRLISAGARVHQTGCNGCIGMGQAPASGRNSIRTVPRNFPGRSGTREDCVWLASPETVAASACSGVIADPRDTTRPYPRIEVPADEVLDRGHFVAPLPSGEARRVRIEKGPNIASMPELDPLPDRMTLGILLVVGDDVSTDEILPAGVRVLPLRSNLPEIAKFAFERVDETYARRASESGGDGHVIVAGSNYGQGSSREHAAAAPRVLGLRAVFARSFARIHRQNLVNFGVLPLVADDDLHPALEDAEEVQFEGLRNGLESGGVVEVSVGEATHRARHDLSPRQVQVVLAGGLIPWVRMRRTGGDPGAEPRPRPARSPEPSGLARNTFSLAGSTKKSK